MWEYDDNEGLWVGDNGYSYDPDANQFRKNDVPMEHVYCEIKQDLENDAREAILEIIGHVAPIAPGEPVDFFPPEFPQGNGITTVQLNDQTIFGSKGATPCLIIFSVWFSEEKNSYYAKGAHRDNVYTLDHDFLADMSDDPENPNWANVLFYIVGGEIGSHTGVEGATMDYSRYYPFFRQCKLTGIRFGGIAFPSNPTADHSTSAALRLIEGQPNVHFWNIEEP